MFSLLLSDLFIERYRRKKRTNYLSDWLEADTEEENKREGSELGNWSSRTTDSSSNARPLVQYEAKIEEVVACSVDKDQIRKSQHVGSHQPLDPETAGIEAKLRTGGGKGASQGAIRSDDAAASLHGRRVSEVILDTEC